MERKTKEKRSIYRYPLVVEAPCATRSPGTDRLILNPHPREPSSLPVLSLFLAASAAHGPGGGGGAGACWYVGGGGGGGARYCRPVPGITFPFAYMHCW